MSPPRVEAPDRPQVANDEHGLRILPVETTQSPAATATPVTLAGTCPIAPPAAQATVRKSGSLATLASAAGHAIFVFALIYAAGSAGRPDHDAETPVEIKMIVEPAAASAPHPEPEPVIEIELPPPLPAPVIEVEAPPPEPQVEPQVEPNPAPTPTEPVEVAQAPPAPVPAPEPKLDLPEPPPPPELTFEPPPPERVETPAALVPPPPPRAANDEADRERAIARQKQIEQRRKEREREAAQERETARQREAAARRELEKTRQQARVAAQKKAAAAQAGRIGSAANSGPRGSSSAMSIDAFRAAVAARIARNRPAGSIAATAQGTVVVTFSVSPSGAAAGVRVAQSSGHGVLDQAAMAAVRRASPFPPPPPGAPRSFNVPMRFNGAR